MKSAHLFAACLVLAAVATPGIAASNEAPLADAGLDQNVTRGATIYLDGSGSRDPDGTIERYHWTVTAESGDVTNAPTPRCRDCQQTRFRADATGTYRVTLEVTDGDGATSTDTLYVTVEPGDPPAASLTGPTETTTGGPTRFTADASAGSAPLDRLVWSVDGEHVATAPVSGEANTTTRTVRFPTTGKHVVSVTAVDEDGQRDSAETGTTVVEASNTGSTGGGFTGSLDDADVVGPQVVTGHGELTADYELTNGGSGTWLQDGQQVATGTSTTRSFDAGVHELYAAIDAGVATFPDDNRTVVADPAPELTTVEVENNSVVPVTINATDGYENLHTVTVHVDGEPVETLTDGRVSGASLTTTTYLESLEPGNHTITVRARDARGQTDVAIRTVEVPGPPEVVSAGFVQDGPLDQYHPRIDESRYTATYRVKVDLNGVEPERVGSSIQIDDYHNRTSNSISVTPALPEIRLETIDPQTEHNRRQGIVFDARESFDPDGSPLKYDWTGVQGGTSDQPRVALSAIGVAHLNVSSSRP